MFFFCRLRAQTTKTLLFLNFMLDRLMRILPSKLLTGSGSSVIREDSVVSSTTTFFNFGFISRDIVTGDRLGFIYLFYIYFEEINIFLISKLFVLHLSLCYCWSLTVSSQENPILFTLIPPKTMRRKFFCCAWLTSSPKNSSWIYCGRRLSLGF